MKFNLIVADPPWHFEDELKQSKTKRGASSNYKVLNIDNIKNLLVKDISEDDSILALWCPSALLEDGLDTMKSWGFDLKQTHIWVKTKKDPFISLKNLLPEFDSNKDIINNIRTLFKLENILNFKLGRLFRQTHEIVLIGVRGKIYQYLESNSQRSVHFAPAMRHSAKPESLQNMLDIMFPSFINKKIELFARRERQGWITLGDECPFSFKEDIRDSINKIKLLNNIDKNLFIDVNGINYNDWNKIPK